MRLIVRRFVLALALSVLVSPGSAQAGAGDDQFVLAAGHYGAERWQAACDEFKKLLTTEPDHPRANQALFFYGEALAQLGRYAEARAEFGELLRRDPRHRYARQALFRSGEAAYLAGDPLAARRDLQTFRDRYPDDELNAYTLAYLGNLELQDGKGAAAQNLFFASLAQFEDGPLVDECRLGLAEAQEQLGQFDQAHGGFRALIDANSPLSDQAMFHLGTVENAQGDHLAALATLDQLATKFPESTLEDQARLGRGYALYKLGRYREAEASLQTLVEHPTLGVEAHYWLGLSQKARGEWEQAAKTLLAGAKIGQQNRLSPALGFHAGDALVQCQQYQAARDEFERVLAQWPDSSWSDDCLLGELRIATLQDKPEECVRLADEFTAKFSESPLEPQVELAKGRALVALARFAEAIEPLESCLKPKLTEQKPDLDLRTEAQSALVMCLAKLGRFAEANRILSALRAAKPRDEFIAEPCYQLAESAFAAGEVRIASDLFASLATPENSAESIRRGLSGLAWCKFKSGDYAGAESGFNRLLNQDPQSPQAGESALMRGRALEHLGQLDAALAMYHLVIDKHATSGRSAEALWRAARLHDQLQQPAQAIELYAKLVQQHPGFSELDAALYRWAWLVREEQPATADELFERLRRDHPRSPFAADAALRLAERAVANQKYEAAEKLLAELTQPNTAANLRQHAWHLQGRMAMARQQWSAVEPPLLQLIENDPDGELALSASYLMAEASYRQGHYEAAAQRLTDLATKTKGHDEPWSAGAELRRAQALAQLKEWSQALGIAHIIGNQFPNFEQQYEVDYLIGRCLAAQAEFEPAREAYAKVIRSPQGSKTQTAAMARWMTGESYFHQENYPAALAEYLAVEKEYPFPRWQAAALLQAGKCHESLGQWRSAADVYGRLLKTYPTSEFDEEATRRMTVAQQRTSDAAKLQ
ncbi:MAG: tetratricopeptide repeat protein [Planctomycetia bacterium]|nr:tetratricopeptide repeat protein [Planctomycetia bacterium]